MDLIDAAYVNMSEDIDFSELDACYSNTPDLPPAACPVDTIDPGLLMSSTALSPSASEGPSLLYTSSENQSAPSTPQAKEIDHPGLQNTMPIMREMNPYAYQQNPAYTQSCPGTPGQDFTQSSLAYSGLSTPISASSLLDGSMNIASMPSMNGSEDSTQHTSAKDKSNITLMANISNVELGMLLDKSMLNLCRNHQASTNVSRYGPPGTYKEIPVPRTSQPRGRLHPMNRRRPLLSRRSAHASRARSSHGTRTDTERELGVWRSQPYPPLESRYGSRAGAQSRQRREAPTSVPEYVANCTIAPSGKNEDSKCDNKIDSITKARMTADSMDHLHPERAAQQSASSSPSSLSSFTLAPAPQSSSHSKPSSSPLLSPFSVSPAIQEQSRSSGLDASSSSPSHTARFPPKLAKVTTGTENRDSVNASNQFDDTLETNKSPAANSLHLLLSHVKRIGAECDALKMLLEAAVSDESNDDSGNNNGIGGGACDEEEGG